MLLLATTAHAKVRTAWFHTLRTARQQPFKFSTRILAFILGQPNFRLRLRQHAGHENGFALMTRYTLSEGIEIGHSHVNDLPGRHAPVWRVELRHSLLLCL